MAPAVVVAAVVVVAAQLAVGAVLRVLLPVLLLEVAEGRALLAHKRLPLVRLQVAVVLLAVLPQVAEVAAAVALLLVQGRVASEILRRR